MKFRRLASLAIAPVLVASLIFALGCGGSKDKDKGGDGEDGKVSEKPKGGPAALAVTETGTLKGRVTLDGPSFKPAKQNFPDNVQNKEECLKGSEEELIEQTWKVSDGGGVQDVVVWLKAPEGKYFKLKDDQMKPLKEFTPLDQPHCAFIPHVSVLFPNYFDEKGKSQPTGQKFKVANSAEKLSHNSNIQPGNTIVNKGENLNLGPKSPAREFDFKSGNKPGQEDLITTSCGVHPWMKSHTWVFDHPFAAVTDKDGNFEIKNVPAGTEVILAYWHESMGKKPITEKATLKAGENQKDLKVKK